RTEPAQRADRGDHGERPRHVQLRRAMRRDERGEIDAIHPLHHQVVRTVLDDEVVDLDDVRVRELAAGARLLDEHVDVVLDRAVLWADVLDRDRALEPSRTAHHGLIHRRHPALTAHADELVLAGDDLTAEVHVPASYREASARYIPAAARSS